MPAQRAITIARRRRVAKTVVGKLRHRAERIARGEDLAHIVVSETSPCIEVRGVTNIGNRRREVSGRAVIAHRCDEAERVDDLRRLVVDRIVAIGRNQGRQRRPRLWCPRDLGDKYGGRLR